jgi:hypothetical protein
MTKNARRLAICKLARNKYGSDDIEIDDNAKLSEGDDNGCFVAAWVWVDLSGTPLDREKDKP